MTTLPSSGPELIAEVGKHPTLDEYMDRDPKTLTEQDLKDLILVLRADRARFMAAEETKKAKREGVVLDADAEFPLEEAA